MPPLHQQPRHYTVYKQTISGTISILYRLINQWSTKHNYNYFISIFLFSASVANFSHLSAQPSLFRIFSKSYLISCFLLNQIVGRRFWSQYSWLGAIQSFFFTFFLVMKWNKYMYSVVDHPLSLHILLIRTFHLEN